MISMRRCYFKLVIIFSFIYAFSSILLTPFKDLGVVEALIWFIRLLTPPLLLSFLILFETDRLGIGCKKIENALNALAGAEVEFFMITVFVLYYVVNSPALVLSFFFNIQLHPLVSFSSSLGVVVLLYLIIRRFLRASKKEH